MDISRGKSWYGRDFAKTHGIYLLGIVFIGKFRIASKAAWRFSARLFCPVISRGYYFFPKPMYVLGSVNFVSRVIFAHARSLVCWCANIQNISTLLTLDSSVECLNDQYKVGMQYWNETVRVGVRQPTSGRYQDVCRVCYIPALDGVYSPRPIATGFSTSSQPGCIWTSGNRLAFGRNMIDIDISQTKIFTNTPKIHRFTCTEYNYKIEVNDRTRPEATQQ